MDPETDPWPARPIPGDVVQLHPKATRWGPVFVTVTECRDWGILGYFYAHDETKGIGNAYVRVAHGSYVRIGVAQWMSEPKNEAGT